MPDRIGAGPTPAASVAAAPSHVVDWPAIIAGAVVATAIGVIFAGFGAALGLSAISPQEGEGSGRFSLILVGLWALVTIIVSYGAGGYVAGRMRRRMGMVTEDESKARDALHGLVVWGLGVLIGAWIASSAISSVVGAAGNVASGAAQAVGGVASAAAGAVGQVAQGAGSAISGAADAATTAATGDGTEGAAGGDEGGLDLSAFNPIQTINNRLLAGTGEQISPGALNRITPVVGGVLANVARTGELSDEDRQFLVSTIADNSTFTEDEINTRVDQAVDRVTTLRQEAADRLQQAQDEAQQALEQAEQAARDAADAARRTGVLTGFLAAAGFAIALAAAMFGASAGGRHRDEGSLFRLLRSY